MGKSDQKEKRLSGGPSTEANGAARQPKADDTIQEWFATLSIEEQARAMGFSDYTILSLLLRHSSLASSFSSNNNEKDGTSGSRTDKKGETNIIFDNPLSIVTSFPGWLLPHAHHSVGNILIVRTCTSHTSFSIPRFQIRKLHRAVRTGTI